MKRFCKFLAACLLLGAWIAPGYALTEERAGELYNQAKRGDAQALKALEQAAAQGLAMAQLRVGAMYHHGEGVPQDYAQARQWYEKAAAQGFAMAQYNLGVLYESGQGVQQDKQAAKEWFGKACDARVQLGCDKYRKLNEAGV